MMDQIQKVLDPLRRRIFNMIARGVIQAVNDQSPIQRIQTNILAGDVDDGIERIQEYGHFSVPLVGAECTLIFIAGNRDHPIIIATDDRRTRPQNNGAGDSGCWNAAGVLFALRNGSKNIEASGFNKLSFSNGTNELMQTISEICQFLIDARTVVTQEPLLSPNDTMAAIKAKIDNLAKTPYTGP
jgi:phage baseplate assembly protein V